MNKKIELSEGAFGGSMEVTDTSKGHTVPAVEVPHVTEAADGSSHRQLDKESDTLPTTTVVPAPTTATEANTKGSRNVTKPGWNRTTRMSVRDIDVSLAQRETVQISAMQKEIQIIKSAVLKLEEAFDDILYSHVNVSESEGEFQFNAKL